jgi:outer membrane receptor protein involved in Fe transport
MSTDGYVLVNRSQRGLVDVPATSEHRVGAVAIERLFSDHSRIFFRGSDFGEQRGNGTPLQTNSTVIRQITFGADWESLAAGSFSLRAYGGPQRFNQGFSSVAADRNSESLTNLQTVPTEQAGVSAQWSRALAPWQVLLAGAEGRDIHGDTRETVFNSGRILRTTDAGGHQRSTGFFVEDMLRVKDRWLLTLAGRFDSWRNFDALTRTGATVNHLRNGDETAFSPRASALYKLKNNIALYAAAYRSFRAPTLNELYRAFRVGNVVTLANENLKAEHVTGTEAGARVHFFNQKLILRGTFFWNQIDQPVANVTLTTTPALITRQRQNLGSTESKGFELETETRITSALSFAAGYQFANATVASFPANPALESLRVPQVPRQQFTFQTRYARSRYTVALQGRAVGTQFDDDQNLLPLAPYFSLDGSVSRSFPHGTEVFVAAENLLNQRAEVSRTPVTTLGPPLLFRIGVRLHLDRERNAAPKH